MINLHYRIDNGNENIFHPYVLQSSSAQYTNSFQALLKNIYNE